MIILGLLLYHVCSTMCGMHGVHCMCCKRGYNRYPIAENPEESGDQVGENGFRNINLIAPEPESELNLSHQWKEVCTIGKSVRFTYLLTDVEHKYFGWPETCVIIV